MRVCWVCGGHPAREWLAYLRWKKPLFASPEFQTAFVPEPLLVCEPCIIDADTAYYWDEGPRPATGRPTLWTFRSYSEWFFADRRRRRLALFGE
jgi:hypothetical protein